MGYKLNTILQNNNLPFFQFPLWDTYGEAGSPAIILYDFQFPLWDTPKTYYYHMSRENFFQFPLWDT